MFNGISFPFFFLSSSSFVIDGWSRDSHPMVKGEYGVFEVFLPHFADGTHAIPHHTKVKVRGSTLSQLPPSFFELDFLKLGCFRSAWCCLLDRGLSVCLRGSLVLSRTRRFLHSSKVRSYPALLPLASILFPFNLLHCVDRNLLESAGEVCVETQATCPWGKHGTEDL